MRIWPTAAMVLALFVAATAVGWWRLAWVTVSRTESVAAAARRWGPVAGGTALPASSELVWSTTGGYPHRDYLVTRLVCQPGPAFCRVTYTEVAWVNGQTGRVDQAVAAIPPSELAALWPHARGGG